MQCELFSELDTDPDFSADGREFPLIPARAGLAPWLEDGKSRAQPARRRGQNQTHVSSSGDSHTWTCQMSVVQERGEDRDRHLR